MSLTNPFLWCVEIELVSEICHKRRTLVRIDGTFAHLWIRWHLLLVLISTVMFPRFCRYRKCRWRSQTTRWIWRNAFFTLSHRYSFLPLPVAFGLQEGFGGSHVEGNACGVLCRCIILVCEVSFMFICFSFWSLIQTLNYSDYFIKVL